MAIMAVTGQKGQYGCEILDLPRRRLATLTASIKIGASW